VVFLLKLRVTPGARGVHSEYLRVALAGLRPLVAELAQLLAASRRIVAGIEHQHHILAAQFGEIHGSSILLGQREIRGLGAGRQRV
jgi:hypothetical protein